MQLLTTLKKSFTLIINSKKIVEDDKLYLKSQFINLNSDLITDFPKLDESLIKTHITLGTYILKQALSYLSEHMNENDIEIRVNKENLNYNSLKISLRSSNQGIQIGLNTKCIKNTNPI